MKSKSTFRSFLLLAGSALLAAPLAHAFTLTWDATAGGAIDDGGGAWLGAGQWNDTGTPSITWTSGDDAIFGVSGTGGAVTLASPTTVNSLIFNTFTGTYTLGTAGQSITLNNGITMIASSGAATFVSPITLGGAQNWTNNSPNNASSSSGSLNINNTLNLNGNALTSGGSGLTSFGSAAAAVISGAGGINVTGGRLWLGAGQAPIHTYSGDTSITGDAVVMISGNASANSNINVNGGVLESYWTTGLTRNLGTGATEVRITGGESGFAMNGSNGATFNLGASAISWGSTNFNPTKFILQNQFSQGTSSLVFSTPINLNSVSADRTIVANAGVSGTASSTISGAITNSAGTGGLIKEGAGNLILSNTANTYNGNTTISAGTLSAAATGSLGNASNTLIFNGSGTTLRATGAITSPSTRAVTLTSTAIIDNNGQAISIAGNITGAGGLIKNGNGTLTLSGTNNYPSSTVNAGTLAIKNEASLNTGAAASWTAANINLKSGATLALNVDSAGTAGFDATDLNTLLGNIFVANSAAQGMQAGATLGIDTGTATGATFTLGSAIANSTGAFGGVINLNKLGAGTLVLDQSNTYTGSTIISGGTIQYDTGAVIPTTPITNNGAFAFNAAGALTQGTNFGIISGTGTVTQSGAGTLTLNLANTYTGATTATSGTIILSNALAIQNSALNTTGAGFVTLSGVTSPTFGGLSNSGTTRDLATVISTGYGSVTNLTLNPQSGSVTYDGVIADGATGMSLTKTGAGTQVLTGIQTYTGATILSGGTLTLSGTGSILPSAITLNGGGLTLTNTAAETGAGRVNDTTVITSNGGTLTYNNTSGANVYAETIGSVALTKGQMNFVLTNDFSAAAGSQTLTLAGLTRTGATNASAITFSAAAGLNATKSRILVTGATETLAGGIAAPWATIGTAANVQTAFAAYDASGYVVAAVPTVAAVDTDLASSTGNYDINTGALYTLTGTRTVNAVQFRGSASTLDLSTFKLETNGFFFSGGAANAKTVTAGIGGALTTPSGGGNLYITTGQVMTAGNEHKISAPITDNSGTVHLVKSGSGTLILSAANNTYTGDTNINAGTLQVGISGSVAQLNSGSYAGNIFIARGAALTLQGNSSNTLSGVISGDGALNANRGTTILSGANTYTGKTSLSLVATNATGSTLSVSSFNSVFTDVGLGTVHSASSSLGAPTTVADGTINLGGGVQATAQINYTGSGETTDRIINFVFNGSSSRVIDSSATGLLKFTSAPFSNGTSSSVILQGSGNGEFVQGLPFSFANFTKNGAGTWTLGGPLRNAGTTTVSAGTLVLSGPVSTTGLTSVNGASTILTLSGDNIAMAGGVTITASRLNIGHANALGTGTLSIGGIGSSLNNTSGSALTIATNNAQVWNGDFTFAGSNDLNLGTGAVALGGTRNVTVAANTLTVGGVISGVSPRGIQKSGAGTLVLAGANDYGGATTVSSGTLAMGANNVLPDTTNVTIANGTLNAATFDDTVGTLAVTNAASAINLGAGANLVFADSSAVAWTGTLNITGTFVSGSSLKFGSSNAALTPTQLLAITSTGLTNFGLDANGFLTADGGGGPGPLDHFAISAISSPQTVGTPITGITLTAQDASNVTVTSFTGTVNFGGTGGFTGTSATFTAGVLNSVSVTPTNAGSGLTFTVTDIGSGKIGTATITTIQTQYQAWSGGALFDADANGDGVKNGLAFLLGASGPSAAVTLPTVSQTGGNLKMTFSMLNAAKRGSATLNVQHSSNLGISDPWFPVAVPDTTPGAPSGGVTFLITPGSPLNGVEATISSGEALSGKLFGRLKAEQ